MEFEAVLRVLIRKWYIILPVFLITFGASVIFTLKQPPIYEARATYIAKLKPVFENDRDFANVLSILSSRIEISSTYAEVANSRRLYDLAMQKLGFSPENRSNLSVSSRLITGTNIIVIAVQGTDPVLTRDFANALGESTIEYVQSIYETFTLAPLDEAVTPRNPIQPKVALNLILGGVLGLILGIGMALLTYYFQTMGKNRHNFPEAEESREVSGAYDGSILQLQQGMTAMQEKFEDTRDVLSQVLMELRRTNSNTKDIRTVVNDLEGYFEGNHADSGNVNLEKDET